MNINELHLICNGYFLSLSSTELVLSVPDSNNMGFNEANRVDWGQNKIKSKVDVCMRCFTHFD